MTLSSNLNQSEGCYCNCHSLLSSRLGCEHCKNNNTVTYQSGESEELRPKLLALLKGGQVINNTTDHNERSVLEMLYGEKADQIEELIHQRELEAKIEERKITKLPFTGDHSKCVDHRNCTGYMNAESDLANENELRIAELQEQLSKQKGNDNEG